MSNEIFEAEVITSEMIAPTANVLELQERSSIDMQIATAKAYPRSKNDFLKRAIDMATLDEETAESCLYRRPVGKDKNGNQNYAEGMSVRMAEIVGSCYGNLRVGSRVVEMTDRFVRVQGAGHDLETNFYTTSECVESTVNKFGKPYDERMRLVIVKAALAKAYRDVMFKLVPRAMAKPIEAQVRNLLFGNIKSMTARRKAAEMWISKLNINSKRVFAALNVKGVEDMDASVLETLTGLRTAIVNKEITIDDAFPEIKQDRFMDAVETSAENEADTTKSSEVPAENENLFDGEKK